MGRPPSELDEYLDWQTRLESFQASGLDIEVFCLQEGISRSTFYRWKERVKDGIPDAIIAEKEARDRAESAEGAAFVPISLKASPVEIELRRILDGPRVSPHVGWVWAVFAMVAVLVAVVGVSLAQRPTSLDAPLATSADDVLARQLREAIERLGVPQLLKPDSLGPELLVADYVQEQAQVSTAVRDTLDALRELSLSETGSIHQVELIASQAGASIEEPAELGRIYAEVTRIYHQHGDPRRTVAWAQAALRLPLPIFQRLQMYQYWSAAAKRVNERLGRKQRVLSSLAPALLGIVESSKYGIPLQGLGPINFTGAAEAEWLTERLSKVSSTRDALVNSIVTEQLNSEEVARALKQLTLSPGFDGRAWRQIEHPEWLRRDYAFVGRMPLKMSTMEFDIASVIDAMVDSQGFVHDVLNSFANDVTGPQIDLRQELFAHLGGSVSVVIDYREEALLQGERILVGIKLSRPRRVEATLERLWRKDPQAKTAKVGGVTVWNSGSEEPGADILLGGGSTGPNLLTNMAVAFDYLFLSTSPQLLRTILLVPKTQEGL